MAGGRSATELGVRTLAIGLDLGAPLLEVARRGFTSTFSNQMGQLGGWISPPSGVGLGDDVPFAPVLHLADDLATILAAREAGDEPLVVALAVPGWLGWCDRHHIARLIDPRGTCQLIWASSPMVAALGTNLAGGSPLGSELVVAIDLDLGVSAAVVAIDRTGIREVVAASARPRWSSRSDAVAAVVAELAELAARAGTLGAGRVVVVADGAGSGAAVEQTIRVLDHAWSECPVDIVRSRAEIARAAVMLAEIDSFEVVGAAPRSVGVLFDDAHIGRPSVHVILPRNSAVPSRTVASFDLGPDDGAQVYLDVYEEQHEHPGRGGQGPDQAGQRLVMTAHLDQPGGTDDRTPVARPTEVEVSFVVGVDGTLQLEAADIGDQTWTCTWADSRLVTSSSSRSTPTIALPGRTVALPRTGAHGRPGDPTVPMPVTREMSPPLGLAEALGRTERIVSRQVGRLVAIRSAPALFGCGDHAALDALHDGADRLAGALERCPSSDAAHAVHVALEVARRAVDAPAGRMFAGGSAREVTREVERVVEYLTVVIGAVTPAERNRLVLDAQLLGFDHQRARALVDELIEQSGVDSDGQPETLHDPTAVVVVSNDGFRLAPAGAPLAPDQAAIRVLLFET